VNLPCRTSVILDSNITGARLRQMAGRAGRRGLDLGGSTVFVHDLANLQNMHAGASSAARASADKYGAAEPIKRESE
jgi:superfamily II RNA helicase